MNTPLGNATIYRHYDAFKLLIDNGAVDSNGRLLFEMVYSDRLCYIHTNYDYYDYYEYIEYMINMGVTDVNYVGDIGYTPLLTALSEGLSKTAKLLIKTGADVNKRNTSRMTALYLASRQGMTECVRLLIAAGADVNAKIREGRTAIGIAKKNRHKDVVDLLVASGAI